MWSAATMHSFKTCCQALFCSIGLMHLNLTCREQNAPACFSAAGGCGPWQLFETGLIEQRKIALLQALIDKKE